MAQELSQEALLDFLCQAGGRVTNAALLSHFRSFLRDPDVPFSEHQRRRELFKGFVNSVAAVRQDPDGTKYVVLKRRYRDLLGEEGLQRPRDPPAPAAPAASAGGAASCSPRGARRGEPRQQQPRRRRREKEQEEEPAGAAPRVADAGCNRIPASGAREAARGSGGRRGNFARRAPVQAAAAAQAGVRCAAAGTQGRCCWECIQNSVGGFSGEPLRGALADSATAAEKPEPAPSARDAREAPGQRREASPAAPPTLQAAVEAAGNRASSPALLSRPSPPGDPPELLIPDALHFSTLQQQQQRTREWVARHPPMPETRDQGPIRAWSVLPDSFLQLPSEPSFVDSEPNSALAGPPLPSHSVYPVPDVSSESWPGRPPLTVFRSIRCQFSLQDLNDFVDQESHGSEESSSGPKESPGGSEEGLPVNLKTPDWGKLRNPAGGLSISPKEGSPSRSPQGLRNSEDVSTSQPVLAEDNGLAGHSQEPLPWPAPKLRRSLRRTSGAGGAKLSSSDEELLDEDLLKRSRRPLRSRKPSKVGAVPSPRVDAALTPNPADIKAVIAKLGGSHSTRAPRSHAQTLVAHRPSEHKSSLVPLDAREHEWIVKLASGSWIQVLTLFWEDPQLALHKDFLTGYTALHWMAKHGDLRALQDLVSGAQKAGIALDVNVRSSGGYTPLHLAAIHGHQGVIKLLVQRLASRVNVRDSSGKKPWQYLTSNTSGEIWQLLGAPRGRPIFPVYSLVQSTSPTRKAKSREVSRNVTRKTSFAALLKSQHSKWKFANQYEKFSNTREREEYSD
ncbi:ankyrin repeat domain-containing protein SOWAHB [Choloepus didactylus]|uniref:ankyrin repeat domain-containing protein SOWAHB n=1 Tax=Choloepus didactylus TaxID=27675 RepID=UPI00189F258E|nr:ankyrin repeat domain-containing protein SOWAHB [Choloepus didactylus]